MHARGSGEAARRAKRGRQPLPSRAISHARGHLRVSRFARRTTEKRETARSLQFGLKIRRGPGPPGPSPGSTTVICTVKEV